MQIYLSISRKNYFLFANICTVQKNILILQRKIESRPAQTRLKAEVLASTLNKIEHPAQGVAR